MQRREGIDSYGIGWAVGLLTVDSECGRCFWLSNHVFHHTCVRALVWWGHLTDSQGVVLQDLKSVDGTDT